MHINHRRKNVHRAKHHNRQVMPLMNSSRPFRQVRNREARRSARNLIKGGLFDNIPEKYPRNVRWEYW